MGSWEILGDYDCFCFFAEETVDHEFKVVISGQLSFFLIFFYCLCKLCTLLFYRLAHISKSQI